MLRDMAHNYENAVLSLDAPAQRHTQASSERRTISRKKARVNCFLLPPSTEARVWSEEREEGELNEAVEARPPNGRHCRAVAHAILVLRSTTNVP